MADNKRYIFDKRDMKKKFIKYGVLLFIALVVLLPLNIWVLKDTSFGFGLFVDVFVALAIVLLGEFIIYKFNSRKGNNKKDK